MSESGQRPRTVKAKPQGKRPAIGLIATSENANQIAGAILRATRSGHDVIVSHIGDLEMESVQFAESLGATVISPNRFTNDRETLRESMITAAKALSYPGIIIQSDAAVQIDFDRSTEQIEDEGFAVDAIHTSSNSNPKIVVGIPAYNEGKTVADIVRDSLQYADAVFVVDDGSSDDTAAQARSAGAKVIQHLENRGYGASLKTVFEKAQQCQPDHLVILDGDGQHDPADIPKLVSEQHSTEAEIVIGSRFAEGSETEIPLYRRFGLMVVNLMTNLSMGVIRKRSRVGDTQSGFRTYSARAIKSLAGDNSIGNHMDASTDILYHAHQHNYSMREVGTTIDYSVEGASNHHPISHGFVLIQNILKTVERDRPMTSLGIPGFTSAFAGLGFGYWTFSNFLQTGTFPMGLAITSAFFGLAGIFACFTAIILHSLNQHLDT